MVILGIDPGIARVGWGIIEVQSSSIRLAQDKVESFGCFETSSDDTPEKRLELIYNFLQKRIQEYKPDTIAIEELFFNTNEKTAMVVGQARGVILLSASRNKIPISVYTPLQVKIALTGYGRAEKDQVGQMVKTILGLSKIPKPDDTADALAVALTHAFSNKMKVLT